MNFLSEKELVSCNTLMGGGLSVSQPCFGKCVWLSVLSGPGDIGKSASKLDLANLNVITALIDLYAKTGHIYLARQVFDSVTEKKHVFWKQ